MPTNPTLAYQAPALAKEPQLLRTLTRVCHQHGATDAHTHQLLRAVVADVRHVTYRRQVYAALTDYDSTDNPGADTLATLAAFAANVIDTEDRRPAAHASAEEIAPEIRRAIATVVDEIWDREKDDYQQQDEDVRDGHPFQALTTLHNWLGRFSPVR
ncbi:hypothetical protein [Nocardia sp. CA-120079]|uniref:hypothetical protein n=1 Tax=Nocardia sp. CA-120079 TaxID=3239974 RepID=UPI003D97874A